MGQFDLNQSNLTREFVDNGKKERCDFACGRLQDVISTIGVHNHIQTRTYILIPNIEIARKEDVIFGISRNNNQALTVDEQ